jgi:hypothetical protein
LWQQQVSIDEHKVLAIAKEQGICHLLYWPLLLTNNLFATQPSWLASQLEKNTSWRYQWLFGRHPLAALSHCNPDHMGLLYGLLWTQSFSKISQWLKLSAHSSEVDQTRQQKELVSPPPMLQRMLQRVKSHFKPKTRQEWHIFSTLGLLPHKDWN